MTTPQNVDVLDDLMGDAPAATPEPAQPDSTSSTTDEVSPTQESDETEENILPEIPEPKDNYKSITDFAGYMSTQLLLNAIQKGDPPDPAKHYVVPQSVYQTVKAQRDRIPHIKVQGPNEEQARVYIDLSPETQPDGTELPKAVAWWMARAERLSTRGQGTARASSRSAEENTKLLIDAAFRHAHAKARAELWTTRIESTKALMDKYEGFLTDQSVSADDIASAVQTGFDSYAQEQAEKARNRKGKSTEDNDQE